MNWLNIATVFATVCTALPRVLGHKGDVYKDFAHIVVGLLIGEVIASQAASRRRLCGACAAALVVVEVICFLVSRA